MGQSTVCSDVRARLDTGGCTPGGSTIITFPAPNVQGHTGGDFNEYAFTGANCNGGASSCQVILDWCNSGAICP